MNKTLVETEESTETVIRCSVNKVFEKLCKIHVKIPMMGSIFSEVSGLETWKFTKSDSSKGVFL